LLALQEKVFQNVMRNDADTYIESYLAELERNLREIANIVATDYGDIETIIKVDKNNILLKWPSLLRIFLAIGTQTQAIRGSEKSMYGKLFEKLILGIIRVQFDR
jgi:actin-like ATPase involved in cell morphogenesis